VRNIGQRGRQQLIVDELISLLAPRGASERLSQAYLRQGNLSTLLKRYDAADRMLSTALRICRERGDVTLERHALRSLGLLRWHEERHAEALAITESALAIDRERHDELAVAGDLANLGVILKNMGEIFPRTGELGRGACHTGAGAGSNHVGVQPAESRERASHAGEPGSRAGIAATSRRYFARSSAADPALVSSHAIAHIFLQQSRIQESLQTYEEAVALSRRAHHADGLVQSPACSGRCAVRSRTTFRSPTVPGGGGDTILTVGGSSRRSGNVHAARCRSRALSRHFRS